MPMRPRSTAHRPPFQRHRPLCTRPTLRRQTGADRETGRGPGARWARLSRALRGFSTPSSGKGKPPPRTQDDPAIGQGKALPKRPSRPHEASSTHTVAHSCPSPPSPVSPTPFHLPFAPLPVFSFSHHKTHSAHHLRRLSRNDSKLQASLDPPSTRTTGICNPPPLPHPSSHRLFVSMENPRRPCLVLVGSSRQPASTSLVSPSIQLRAGVKLVASMGRTPPRTLNSFPVPVRSSTNRFRPPERSTLDSKRGKSTAAVSS